MDEKQQRRKVKKISKNIKPPLLNVRKQRGFCLYIDSDLYIFNAFVPEQRGAYPRKAELRQHTVFPQEYVNV